MASLRDLAATKIKVLGDRGELRDYFDLMVIVAQTPITAESALLDYQARYGTNAPIVLAHLARALGSFADVTDDPGLPVPRSRIETYWRSRQPSLLAALDFTGFIHGAQPRRAPGPPDPRITRHRGDGGMTWVEPHVRDGQTVRGHWRRR